MSNIIVWDRDGDPYALLIAGGGSTVRSYVLTPVVAPIAHQYESLPPTQEWDIMGSPLQGITHVYEAKPPITEWDTLGAAVQPAGTLHATDAGYKYVATSIAPHVWDSLGQAAAPNPPEQLNVGNTGIITISGFIPQLLEQDMLDVPYGISETITGFAPTLLEANDYGLIVSTTPAITLTGFAPQLVEFNSNDEQLLVPFATIQVTGFAPDLVEQEQIDVASAPLISITGFAPTLDEQGLLPPVLSYSDAKVVWDLLLVHGLTMRQAIGKLLDNDDLLFEKIRRGEIGGSGVAANLVSAGGRGLYFEPQTIDKLLDEIKKAYALAESKSKEVIERIIEKQPIYITQPGQMQGPWGAGTKTVGLPDDVTEDEEEAIVAAIAELLED